MITPGPHDALLFERSFLSYQDRVHLLRAGYLSVVTLARDRYDELRAQFARHAITIMPAEFEERVTARLSQLDQVIASPARPKQPSKDVSMGVGHSSAALPQEK